VPEFALPRVFERFYSLPRPDGARSSGIGLSFVREVAALHGGEAWLRNREAAAPRRGLDCRCAEARRFIPATHSLPAAHTAAPDASVGRHPDRPSRCRCRSGTRSRRSSWRA
jgi:signal transduction histidine kinase